MTNLEGVRLTLSQPDLPVNVTKGLAALPVDNEGKSTLKVGELYYTEDRDDSGNIIPRLFTKTSDNTEACLTPHIFSGTKQPENGYRDGDIWIKTVE